jgi:hypothetical protein
MSASCEAAELVRRCAEPSLPGESVKLLIRRAARRTGLSASRVKAIWYREAASILAPEMDRLRELSSVRRKDDDAARTEYQELLIRLERIEEFMAKMDSRMEGEPADR